MKKYLGAFAVVLAVVLSSFSISKKSQTQYSWFDQRTNPHTLIEVTESLDDNPTNCVTTGSSCVKAYAGDLTGQSEPNTSPARQFAINP
jgi:hypothetical protein